jgi:hypothetical protein
MSERAFLALSSDIPCKLRSFVSSFFMVNVVASAKMPGRTLSLSGQNPIVFPRKYLTF